MKIPSSKRRKALIIVDVQSVFLDKHSRHIVKNIQGLIKNVHYDLYVDAVFHAEKGSIWDMQTDWTAPEDKNTFTVKEISSLLKGRVVKVKKTTKSTFKVGLVYDAMKKAKIKEVHIVGLQTNDCILATAYEGFDLGLFTYVIEECCESDTSNKQQLGLKILRYQNLTNNSCVEKIDFTEIS